MKNDNAMVACSKPAGPDQSHRVIRSRRLPDRGLRWVFLSVLALAAPPWVSVATAGSDTWTGQSGSSTLVWSNAANWNPGVPKVGDDLVFFIAPSPSKTVYVDGSFQINSITLHPNVSEWFIDVEPAKTLTFTGPGISHDGESPEISTLGGSGGTRGGSVQFLGSATAADISLVNDGGSASGEAGGYTQFMETSTAGTALVINDGGTNGFGGYTDFEGSATAGDADLTSYGGIFSGSYGGATVFSDSSTAGHATLTAQGASSSGATAGETKFFDSTTAANATIITNSGANDGEAGGETSFFDTTTAANATITNNGDTVQGAGIGQTAFFDSATAGQANLTNNGGASGPKGPVQGTTKFFGDATADHATINNNGGVANGFAGGATQVFSGATAGNATINNNGGAVFNAQGGVTTFFSSTAGNATITTYGGAVSGAKSGTTQFTNTATAGSATLITNGSLDNNTGAGEVDFKKTATAGNATLITNGPTVSGGRGGFTAFFDSATGGTARAITDTGGQFAINFLTTAGMDIGSIEGGGIYVLGKKNLTVGGNNLSTTVTGVIEDRTSVIGDTGGSLTKVGSGSLTLTATNTYTGPTTVNGGTLFVDNTKGSGTGTGALTVNTGGTLGGTGGVGGMVTVNSGGVVAPGHSPGTLSINGNYIQNSGGALKIELGGAGAGIGFDQLVINGNASLDGILNLSLVSGFRPAVGDTFAIIACVSATGNFATINSTGFSVRSDVSKTGVVLTVTDVAPVPVITSPTSASGTKDQPFTYQITATDSPTSFGASGLPAGLSVNATNGVISGTPAAVGSFAVTISATNSAGPGSATLTLTISPPPSATPGLVGNVSTRLPVGTDDNVLIEGFIVQGPAGSTKKILVRAIGPSLSAFGITDALANPVLEIYDETSAKVASNDDWKTTQVGGLITGDQSAEISASQLAPGNDLESAIIADLAPGSYTAVVRGAGNTIGTGVVDAYDLSAASPARLANIATRGLIQAGDKLMIAGFIVQNGPVRVVIRAIGPSLSGFGIANALADTTLQLRDVNGVIVLENDNWKTDQQQDLEATGLQPTNDLEAALVTTIQPGQYTAQVRGKNDSSGIGVVQVYFVQ
jgi:Passenger-associated-transport-repeat